MFKVRGPVGKTFQGFRDAVIAAFTNFMEIGHHDGSFYFSLCWQDFFQGKSL